MGKSEDKRKTKTEGRGMSERKEEIYCHSMTLSRFFPMSHFPGIILWSRIRNLFRCGIDIFVFLSEIEYDNIENPPPRFFLSSWRVCKNRNQDA